MSLPTQRVLVEVVDRYRESSEPVSRQRISRSLDCPPSDVSPSLDRLADFELVEATAEGYRPTVTACELLELEVELDDVLVLDLVEE
jgi:predicted transcriptional regulator